MMMVSLNKKYASGTMLSLFTIISKWFHIHSFQGQAFVQGACSSRTAWEASHFRRSYLSSVEQAKSASTQIEAETAVGIQPPVSTSSNSSNEECLNGPGTPSPRRRKKKIRQHVNPLTTNHQTPIELPPDWVKQTFSDPARPLHLDIGSAGGKFLRQLATMQMESSSKDEAMNFLGLEIRKDLAIRANEYAEKLGLSGHLHYLACNANVEMRRFLTDLTTEGSTLQLVTVNMPDPHFKKKHHKRRVLTPELVSTICDFMAPGAAFFVQSDIFEVAEEMRLRLRAESRLADTEENFSEWLNGEGGSGKSSPMKVPTEREKYVYSEGGKVYRAFFKIQ